MNRRSATAFPVFFTHRQTLYNINDAVIRYDINVLILLHNIIYADDGQSDLIYLIIFSTRTDRSSFIIRPRSKIHSRGCVHAPDRIKKRVTNKFIAFHNFRVLIPKKTRRLLIVPFALGNAPRANRAYKKNVVF